MKKWHCSYFKQITQVWTKLSSKIKKNKQPTATRYRVLPSVPALPSSAMEVSSKLSLKIHQQKYWSETWTRGSSKSKLFAPQGEAECSAAYTGSSLMTCTSGSSLLTPYGWVWWTSFPLPPPPLVPSSSRVENHLEGLPPWLLLRLLLDRRLDLRQLPLIVSLLLLLQQGWSIGHDGHASWGHWTETY